MLPVDTDSYKELKHEATMGLYFLIAFQNVYALHLNSVNSLHYASFH